MTRSIRTSHVVLLAALFAGCAATGPDGFTKDEWAIVQDLSPLPDLPADPTNAFADDPAAAVLGQKLFFEQRYSGPIAIFDNGVNGGLATSALPKKVSCAKCHAGEDAFIDTRTSPNNVSLGVKYTERNAPSLINVAYYEWHGWAGKQDALWTQASLSPESGTNSAGNRGGYAHMIWDFYKTEYETVFPAYPLPAQLDPADPGASRFPASAKPKKLPTSADGPWELMLEEDRDAVMRIMANSGKATAAYERLLVSRNAPFDQYVDGDEDAISFAAKRGLKLFVGRAFCVECHAGPFFTDQGFHNIGVPQDGPNLIVKDEGRLVDLPAALKHEFNSGSEWSDDPALGQVQLSGLTATEEDLGLFRTSTLRGIAETGPYFHNGWASTLQDAVWHYDRGGAPGGYEGEKDFRVRALGLSETDVDDLVAFLETLTGEPIPESLTRPDPWDLPDDLPQ